MKLNEIKNVLTGYHILSEGVIPVHLTMTLEQVINSGKVTNNVQYFIMAGLSQMFKDGGPARWPRDLNPYSMSTDANLIEAIKSLSTDETVYLAKWLLEALQQPENFEADSNSSYHPDMTSEEWVRWVIKRQD